MLVLLIHGHRFDVESVKDSRVRSYNHQDLSSMVTKGKRKLRKSECYNY